MRSLYVDYTEQFPGIGHKPGSYKVLADRFEWAKRGVEQDLEGQYYNECTAQLDALLQGQKGKVIVECGCGLGRNLHRYARDNTCIGLDFSTTGLAKIRGYASGVVPVNADIRAVPLREGSADFVIFCNVLFIYEDLEQIAHMLREARRMLKPGGQVIVINDYCSAGVALAPFLRVPAAPFRGGPARKEFILYYFDRADAAGLLDRAGFEGFAARLCNFHLGVYHLTYLSPVFGALLRNHRQHRKVRRMDHWERVRGARCVNDAYPLNLLGRGMAAVSRRFWPSLAALSLCCTARKPGGNP
jgi:SAM-dependent methyltransferase